MSISQQSQPNEAVSPDMGELYELLQWMPEKSQWKKPFLFSFPLRKVAQVKKIVCYEIQLSTCVYLLPGPRSERHIDWHNWNRSGKTNPGGRRETNKTEYRNQSQKKKRVKYIIFFSHNAFQWFLSCELLTTSCKFLKWYFPIRDVKSFVQGKQGFRCTQWCCVK